MALLALAAAILSFGPSSARGEMILDWDFDIINGSPPEVTDGSGNQNDGTLGTAGTGTVSPGTLGTGPFSSNYLAFTGNASNGGYADGGSGYDDSLNLTGDYAISAWFEGHNASTNEIVAGRYHDASYNGFVLRFDEMSSTHDQISYTHLTDGTLEPPAGWVCNYVATSVPGGITSGWHHAVGVFKVGVGSKLYFDGDYVGLDNTTTVGLSTFTPNFRVGAQDHSSAPRGFNGGIDEVKLYDTAIGDSNVVSLFKTNTARDKVLDHHFEAATPLTDSTVFGNDGTISGSVTHVAGGGPFADTPDYHDFGGGHINAGSDASLDVTGNYSLSLWFEGHNASLNGGMAGRYNGGGNKGFVLWFDAATDRVAYWHVSNGALEPGAFLYNDITTAASFTSGWHHAVAVFEEGLGSSLFIDGVEITAATAAVFSPSTTTDAISSFVQDFRIGEAGGGTSRPFRAGIDEVKLFNYALSDAEIDYLFHHNATVPEPSGLLLLAVGLLLAAPCRRRRGI